MKPLAIEPAVNVNQSEPENIRAMIVIDSFDSAEFLESVLSQVPEEYDDILVVGGNPAKMLLKMDTRVIHHKAMPGDRLPISIAVSLARHKGITHLVTLGRNRSVKQGQLQVLYEEICTDRDAIILGRPTTTGSNRPGANQRHGSSAGFWLRLQTGTRITDPRNAVRVYPVTVLENLKFFSRRPYVFEMEVLVRGAWAGVDLKEVDLDVSKSPSDASKVTMGKITLADRFWMFILNVHLTMRSITPLPHKKIVTDIRRPGEKISVLHPLRSIRMLLTENTSPGQLALTAALGVFLGALPLIAFHNITILFAAGYFRLNKVAALVASQLCMPPLVPALCIEVGYFMRHGEFLTEFSIKTIGYQAPQRLLEWLLGSLVLAPVLAALVGGTVYILAFYIQKSILQKK
jgi:uncharacterized protein (DUF2062 family)